mgnify:CR=1 FL=1
MKNSIAVIGGGGIGKRHLQSLSYLDRHTDIFLVDPSLESLEIARDLFESTARLTNSSARHKLTGMSEISHLPKDLDLCIVATCADVRYEVVVSLLNTSRIKNLVLEKILFQQLEHYGEVQSLFEKFNVKSWVNCPLRGVEPYRGIKDSLNGVKPIRMEVSGRNWGLASNSVHFLDLFEFYTNSSISEKLDLELVTAYQTDRRHGRSPFFEYFGTLRASNDHGDEIVLDCKSDPTCEKNFVIQLMTKESSFVVEYVPHLVRYSHRDGARVVAATHDEVMQSELTHEVVNSILDAGEVDIPTYSEATNSHILLLKCLIGSHNKFFKVEDDIARIT